MVNSWVYLMEFLLSSHHLRIKIDIYKVANIIKNEFPDECDTEYSGVFAILYSPNYVSNYNNNISPFGILCEYLLSSIYILYICNVLFDFCNSAYNVNFIYNYQGCSYVSKCNIKNGFIFVTNIMANFNITSTITYASTT